MNRHDSCGVAVISIDQHFDHPRVLQKYSVSKIGFAIHA